MIQKTTVTCLCGAIIPGENIDYANRCNEEGEEYGTVMGCCDKCDADYETSEWGEWEGFNDAAEHLRDYIDNIERV